MPEIVEVHWAYAGGRQRLDPDLPEVLAAKLAADAVIAHIDELTEAIRS
ncbi:hypothetical protein ABZX12_15885 [Kribbella sp. NPDC003505]